MIHFTYISFPLTYFHSGSNGIKMPICEVQESTLKFAIKFA